MLENAVKQDGMPFKQGAPSLTAEAAFMKETDRVIGNNDASLKSLNTDNNFNFMLNVLGALTCTAVFAVGVAAIAGFVPLVLAPLTVAGGLGLTFFASKVASSLN